MPKIGLVTGCAGFIGSHLCERLLADGWNVIGIDDLSAGSLDNLSNILKDKRFSFIKADITNHEELDPSIFKGVDCVFHHAGIKDPYHDVP